MLILFNDKYLLYKITLDWFTCGKMSRGERWDFLKYDSGINLILGDKLIFRDVVLLKNDNSTLKKWLEPYECYAQDLGEWNHSVPLEIHIQS